MIDGVFKGAAKGFHGLLTSSITIKNGEISKVDVDGVKPYSVEAYAIPTMVKKIEKAGTTDVDVVTSASVSTSAVVNGVNKALEVANNKLTEDDALNPDIKPGKMPNMPVYAKVSSQKYVENHVSFKDGYDVIVVGSGISGLSAAIEAKKHGNDVVIFEKTGLVGGTSNYSAGVIQGSGDEYQKKFTKYQNDTPELHAKELIQAGEGRVNPQIIKELAEDSANNIEWLANLGVKWTSLYGHRVIPYENKEYFAQRIHVYEHGGGLGSGCVMINAVKKEAERLGIKIFLDTPVIGLVTKSHTDNSVVGVVTNYKGSTSFCRANKGVVLAAASIDYNESLAKEYAPQQYRDIKNHALTNSKYDTGDGILMGLALNAATEGLGGAMDVDFKSNVGAADNLPTPPMFYVNGNGLRYVNEDSTYGYLTRATYQQELIWNKPTWQIFDSATFSAVFTPWQSDADTEKDVKNGKMFKADSIQDLATKINVPAQNLAHQLQIWNENAAAKKDSEFGRKEGLVPLEAPFYAYAHQDSNFGSIGGLKVTTNFEVVDHNDNKIANLYAVGCNSGGWNANYYPSSGTALAEGMHSGRKVGKVLSGLVEEVKVNS